MIINSNNYFDFILNNFKCIAKTIKKTTNELSPHDFKNVFDSEEAKQARDIIYIFMAKEKVPRLKGESRIVYIGQTKRSLQARHSSTSRKKAESEANKAKYNHIIKHYQEITVYYLAHKEYAPDLSLVKLEGQFLWWYFQNHLEYPPLNYTKTKIRTPEYKFLTPQTNKSNQETKQ